MPWFIWDNVYLGNPNGPAVAVLGDSVTNHSYDSIHAALDPTYRTKIAGMTGYTWFSLHSKGDEYASDSIPPRVVVINLGANDVRYGPEKDTPPDELLSDMDRFVAMFPDACKVLVTLPAQVTPDRLATYQDDRARLVNDHDRQLADVIVPWGETVDADPARYVKDDVHPTVEGRDRLAAMVRAGVDTCFEASDH